MLQGLVFNIQRFSLHDGPGIRTNVFFKGCPLDCKWCSNPESKHDWIEVAYNKRKCTGCLMCTRVCPNEGITNTMDGIKLNSDLCTQCFNCVNICSAHALYMEGVKYTVEELTNEVLKDIAFYKKSGGGITISGGEPFLQKEFVREFLQSMKRNNISVVAETTGYVDSGYFRQIIKLIDILYFDVKHPNSTMYKKMVGQGNELILENFAYAIKSDVEVVVRLPVIPGFNDTEDAINGFINLFKKTGAKRIHLLPFHNYGAGKYDMLGLKYDYKNIPNTKKEELLGMKEIFSAAGFDVQIGGS